MIWSVDIYADDWKRISSEEIADRPLERLERAGKGIVLFHDIHSRTAAAIPAFLRGLKERGFKIVQVAPADAEHPMTETKLEEWHALDRSLLKSPSKK